MSTNQPSSTPRCPACLEKLRSADLDQCPECGQALSAEPGAALTTPGFYSTPAMRYPNLYTWMLLLSTMDVLLTFLVLHVWGGVEANPVAAGIIDKHGFHWAMTFKFAMTVLAILSCEWVGRKNDKAGRRLAIMCLIVVTIPVLHTFALLHTHPLT